MQVLVTGATGFLGRRVIHALTREGATVLALARSAAARDAVTALGATPVPGDLDRPGGLVLPPADAVIHAAALFRLAGPRADFVRTNVAGTAALLAAARAAGVPRFVNVGAAAVVMDDGGAPVRLWGRTLRALLFPRQLQRRLGGDRDGGRAHGTSSHGSALPVRPSGSGAGCRSGGGAARPV